MTRDVRVRLGDERGFTLLEILVVVLILSILAAIALVLLPGNDKKADDAAAKSVVRNLVTHVESCGAQEEDFRSCDTQPELGDDTFALWGTGPERAEVTTSGKDSFEIVGQSGAETAGKRHSFRIRKSLDGTQSRTCSPAGTGGCSPSGGW